MFSPGTVAGLLAPALALLAGAFLAQQFKPNRYVRSGLQHLAAGIIVAAVAVDLVPPMVDGSEVIAVFMGFVLGVSLVMFVRVRFQDRDEERRNGGLGLSRLLTVGIDLLVDGLLVGVAMVIANGAGAMLSIAISIEVLALGLALGSSCRGKRQGRRLLRIMLCLAACLLGAGVLGILLGSSLEGPYRAGLIAFGCAALLYLVVEDLLVEAHQTGESTFGSIQFFVGFGIGILLAILEH